MLVVIIQNEFIEEILSLENEKKIKITGTLIKV